MVNTHLPIALSDIEVRRSGATLLGPLTLRLETPGITTILGPNGAGKTTFLRMLHGMERINRGKIEWPIESDVLRAEQAFVFQKPTMMRRSVVENLMYPLRLSGVPRAVAYERALVGLANIGLGHMARREAHFLSGGERQKLALARALIRAPKLLFLDEPCANLDGSSVRDIERILADARRAGRDILMATHDMAQAKRLADHVIFLHKGKLVESTAAPVFFAAPSTPQARAFLSGDILL